MSRISRILEVTARHVAYTREEEECSFPGFGRIMTRWGHRGLEDGKVKMADVKIDETFLARGL